MQINFQSRSVASSPPDVANNPWSPAIFAAVCTLNCVNRVTNGYVDKKDVSQTKSSRIIDVFVYRTRENGGWSNAARVEGSARSWGLVAARRFVHSYSP